MKTSCISILVRFVRCLEPNFKHTAPRQENTFHGYFVRNGRHFRLYELAQLLQNGVGRLAALLFAPEVRHAPLRQNVLRHVAAHDRTVAEILDKTLHKEVLLRFGIILVHIGAIHNASGLILFVQ